MVKKIISKGPLILFLYLLFSFITTTWDLVNNSSILNYVYFFLSIGAMISAAFLLIVILREKLQAKKYNGIKEDWLML
jgi:hypothetical protein